MAEEVPKAEVDQSQTELTVFSADIDLATAAINRHIEAARSEGESQSIIELLELQRDFVSVPLDSRDEGFDPIKMTEAIGSQNEYVRRTGDTGSGVNPIVLRTELANEERWRIVGIDPAEHQGQAITASAVEAAWSEAAGLEKERREVEKRALSAQADANMILDDFIADGTSSS